LALDSDEEGSTTNESDEDEEEDDEVPPHCQICWNMNSNDFVTKNALNPVCSGKCVAKLIEKHSIKPTVVAPVEEKAKIPDDMMVVPRYMFENEKGEKVKWVLCVMKL
jgi:hypothetical protein